MNGKEILVDTNILLYLLQGNDTLADLLLGKTVIVSFITELELIGFPRISSRDEHVIGNLLKDCTVVTLTREIKEVYVNVRKRYQLKLADAIIAATALSMNLPLVTADRQFRKLEELHLVAYQM